MRYNTPHRSFSFAEEKEYFIGCIFNGKYTLENLCGSGCPCKLKEMDTHLNLFRRFFIEEGIDISNEFTSVRYVNVRGREEHESVLKDAVLCEQLGLDQYYEIMIYLKRWGNWLKQ